MMVSDKRDPEMSNHHWSAIQRNMAGSKQEDSTYHLYQPIWKAMVTCNGAGKQNTYPMRV